MEDLLPTKNQPSSLKAFGRKNTLPAESTPDLQRAQEENKPKKKKALVFHEDLLAYKTPPQLSKTPAVTRDSNIFMSSAIVKSITPQMSKNFQSRSPAPDQMKKTYNASQFERTPKRGVFMSDDKNKARGSFDSPTGTFYEFEPANETMNQELNDPTSHKRKMQKLPSLIDKKKLTKRSAFESKNSPNVGYGKAGDPDLHVHSLIVNHRASISPLKGQSKMNPGFGSEPSGEKRQERILRMEEIKDDFGGKSYSEDKVQSYTLYKGMQQDYNSVKSGMKGSPNKTVVKILNFNLSGGEEEETNNQNLSGSLHVAALKGAQRTLKKKRAETFKERKATTPDAKGKILEGVLIKKSKKVKEMEDGERQKVLKIRDEGVGSKRKIKELLKESKEKKEENKEPAMEMEGWSKNDSGGESQKEADEEEEQEEKEEKEPENEEKDGSKQEVKVMKSQSRVFEDQTPKKQMKMEKSKEVSVVSNTIRKSMVGGTKEMFKPVKKEMPGKPMTDREKDLKREHAYREFILRLNFSFNVIVKNPTAKAGTTYKYFLGKGNNSIMIRAMMKQRWWWTQVDNKEAPDLNFIWTQLKQNKFIEGLRMTRKTPFENMEGSGLLSQNDNANQSTTTLDSMTDCESDTAGEDSKLVVKKNNKKTQSKKTVGMAGSKNNDDSTQAALKLLYTPSEIQLMNSLVDGRGRMPLAPEDYEEIGKQRRGPVTQVIQDPSTMKMSNRLESNFHLANKKALLWNMKSYYEAMKENVFDYLPLTFHVRQGFEDKEYQKFLEYYNNREAEIQEQEKMLAENKEAKKKEKKLRNLWIVKPGENTNRGVGINVCNDLSQINEFIATTEGNVNEKKRTYLIQQYLDRPLLYNKRKFDIRCYILITCINGTMKGYWYQEGYIRTASKEFSLKNVTNKLIHLTNDAVQKKAEDYGKFEAGNKLSYNDFQKYLESTSNGTTNFMNDIYPQIRKLAIDCIKGVYGKIDPYRRENSFEVFGLDFMIDTDLKAWLIEVNTNPDINASSPALIRVIPNMVENALRLTIDQMYPPPTWAQTKKTTLPENMLENNKFELVFDEVEDGAALRAILQPDKGATGDMILDIVAEEEEEVEDENN